MKKIMNKFSEYYIMFAVYCLIGWLYEVFMMWFICPPYHFVNRGVLLGPFLPIYGFGMLTLIFLLNRFMSKKHPASNRVFLTMATAIVTSFIYVTVIEYTTPKIYRVDLFLDQYGLGLFITNAITIIVMNLLVSKTDNKKIKNFDLTIFLVFLAIWIITTLIEYGTHYVIDTFQHKMLWDYTKDFLNINKRVNWDASRNFAIGGTFLLYTIQPVLNKLNKSLKENTKLTITLIIGIPMLLDYILHVVLHII